jgi:rod shape determining protein RodA
MIGDRRIATIDWNFIGTALVIAAVGCLAVYSATWNGDPSGAPLSTFKKQILWVGIGLALMILFMLVDYHVLFDVAPILYGIGVVLLIYLLVWGKVTANVKSWIHIGGFQFQPAEFMKIFTALMLAKFFDSNDRAYLNLRSFMYAMGIIMLPVGLIAIQPDFGTAASFAPLVAVTMFFGGIRLRVWAIMILVGIIALPSAWLFFLKPYQKERIMIFLNPERDPLGTGYQVTQAKIAIGSGGIHGKGFKQGTQASLGFLPARHTDFIFAVLGEEWGFIGVTIVLGLYLYLIVQAMTFAKHARDRGGTFLCICLISFIIFHVFINVAMQIGVLPTTGIPLPLVSYGGSSTMMFMIAIGIIANVDMRRFVNA